MRQCRDRIGDDRVSCEVFDVGQALVRWELRHLFAKLMDDPAIFELAARRFGHAPGEMLFVDDNPANIAAARRLGWHVDHFTDAERLAEGLRE